jgi:hypothetical protein
MPFFGVFFSVYDLLVTGSGFPGIRFMHNPH